MANGAPDRTAEEEQPGMLFRWLCPLLRLGVEIEEYGLAAVHIVNHVIQGAHHDIRTHMAVIRQQRGDVAQPHVLIVGTIIPGQDQPTMTCEGWMIDDVPDPTGHAQVAASHHRTRVATGEDTLALSSPHKRSHPQHR